MIEIIVILLVGGILIFVILLALGIFDKKKKDSANSPNMKVGSAKPNNSSNPVIKEGNNYIKPAEFNIGLVKPTSPFFMNNCNTNVLYPINGLDPNYQLPNIPNNAPCLEFVQPP